MTLYSKPKNDFSILENPDVTSKSFAFTTKNGIPLYYVSASDGTNVVKLFNDAVKEAVKYKKDPVDIEDQIMSQHFKTLLAGTIQRE